MLVGRIRFFAACLSVHVVLCCFEPQYVLLQSAYLCGLSHLFNAFNQLSEIQQDHSCPGFATDDIFIYCFMGNPPEIGILFGEHASIF